MRARFIAIAYVLCLGTSIAQADRTIGVDDWHAGLEAFRAIVIENHPNPFHALPEAEFHAAVTRLTEQVPELTDAQTLLELQRIVAALHDGHSTMLWFQQAEWFRALPLHLYWFEDGLFVRRAMAPHETIERGRIEAIGGQPIADVWDNVIAFQQQDNPWFAKAYGTSLLVNAELLHHLGYTDDPDSASVTFERDGERRTIEIPSVPWSHYIAWRNDAPLEGNPPLYRSDQTTPYWITHIPEHNAVYMRFNAVVHTREAPLGIAGQRIIELFEDRKASCVIIDARGNGGGDGTLLRRLLNDIEGHPAINTRGNLFVITDRFTFSAAMMFVTRIARRTEAMFVGEPAGGRPNHYGDAVEFTLPRTGLRGRLSSLYHQESDPDDTRELHPVDLPAPLYADDYWSGHDAALEAIWMWRETNQ